MSTATPAQDVFPAAGVVVSMSLVGCPFGHRDAEEHKHACESCRELAALLPKLAQPGWVQWIGATLAKPALAAPGPKLSKKEERKQARLRYKREQRRQELLTALRPRLAS